jgi:hypothetical protein
VAPLVALFHFLCDDSVRYIENDRALVVYRISRTVDF